MERKTAECKYCGQKTTNCKQQVCSNCVEKLYLIRTIKRMLGGSNGQQKKDL
jgi:hypothetical protein